MADDLDIQSLLVLLNHEIPRLQMELSQVRELAYQRLTKALVKAANRKPNDNSQKP